MNEYVRKRTYSPPYVIHDFLCSIHIILAQTHIVNKKNMLIIWSLMHLGKTLNEIFQ